MAAGDYLRKLFVNRSYRPMNFSFVDDHVCGSALITGEKEVGWLRSKKVGAILALTETPAPSSLIERYGMEYRHIAIKDHTSPSVTQLDECVDFIETNIRKGNKVLVHCAAGKGRTGTILAAYLCEHYDLTPEAAMNKVRAKRPGSIERNPIVGQEKAVIEYSQMLRKRESFD